MRHLKVIWIALGCGIFAISVETAYIGLITSVVAQDDLDAKNFEPSHNAADAEAGDFKSPADAFRADKVDGKEDYLKLARQKADLLTPEELARETLVLRQELTELQATMKLRSTEQQLQKLIDEFPNSSAAQRAKSMLRGGLKPVPVFDHDPVGSPNHRTIPAEDFHPQNQLRPTPSHELSTPFIEAPFETPPTKKKSNTSS